MDTSSELGFLNLKNNIPMLYLPLVEELERLHADSQDVKSRLYSMIEEALDLHFINIDEYQALETTISEYIA